MSKNPALAILGGWLNNEAFMGGDLWMSLNWSNG